MHITSSAFRAHLVAFQCLQISWPMSVSMSICLAHTPTNEYTSTVIVHINLQTSHQIYKYAACWEKNYWQDMGPNWCTEYSKLIWAYTHTVYHKIQMKAFRHDEVGIAAFLCTDGARWSKVNNYSCNKPVNYPGFPCILEQCTKCQAFS